VRGCEQQQPAVMVVTAVVVAVCLPILFISPAFFFFWTLNAIIPYHIIHNKGYVTFGVALPFTFFFKKSILRQKKTYYYYENSNISSYKNYHPPKILLKETKILQDIL
jgi:hypothetical protein